MNHATATSPAEQPAAAPQLRDSLGRPCGKLTVRRAIAIGARAAALEDDVAVPDDRDPEGYGFQLRAGDDLEAALHALDDLRAGADLYGIAWTVREAMRKQRRDGRMLARNVAAEERAAICRFYAFVLRRQPANELVRGTARAIVNGYERDRQARIDFELTSARLAKLLGDGDREVAADGRA